MRILVIDDYLNVEMALRGILDEHTVSGVARSARAAPDAGPRGAVRPGHRGPAVRAVGRHRADRAGDAARAVTRHQDDHQHHRRGGEPAALPAGGVPVLRPEGAAGQARRRVRHPGRGRGRRPGRALPQPGRGPVPQGRRDAAAAARPAGAQPDRAEYLAGAGPLRQAPPDRQRRPRPPAHAGRLHGRQGHRHRRGDLLVSPAGPGAGSVGAVGSGEAFGPDRRRRTAPT